MIKVSGVLVVYNPSEMVWGNIQSYLDCVDFLFVIDNSDVKNIKLIRAFGSHDKIVYVDNDGNHGVAEALNTGAEMAIEYGASWLLTMDQDSYFEKKSFSEMIGFIQFLERDHRVGVVSPVHITTNFKESKKSQHDIGDDGIVDLELCNEVDVVMTSGNLINLTAYTTVGGFLNKYFIDSVDHEYCLRLKKNSFSILVFKRCFLKHNLGEIDFFNFFGKRIYYTNHSALRRYYITRNRLDLILNYIKLNPRFCFCEIYRFFSEWVKIILFEKEKIKKNVFILKGVFDFLFGKFGKF